jgi:dCMP deaminase
MNKWQHAYMDTAERFGALSTAKRLQVGAIVVKDNRIISIGYNGMPSGWSNECEEEVVTEYESYTDSVLVTKKEVIHAEANVVGKLASSNESGRGAEMYVTHSPCIECAKQIYTAGISKVYFKIQYRSTDGTEFLKKCGVEVEQLWT